MESRSLIKGFTILGLTAFLALGLILFIASPASAQAENETTRIHQVKTAAVTHHAGSDKQQSLSVATADDSGSVAFEFLATAYCLRGITFSGVRVRAGIVAADPKVLPIGSIIRLEAGKYSGIYTVLDTGAKIKGRRLDLWLPTYKEAIQFGVRKVSIKVIRYGWNPLGTEISSL